MVFNCHRIYFKISYQRGRKKRNDERIIKEITKKSNKKGFTLVEIIVVLVILAILAAIAVPSVLGYVNEAKEERYIQEAHSIYVVIQTEEAKSEALGETTPTYGKGTAAADAKIYRKLVFVKKRLI